MITFANAQAIWASRRPHNGSVHLNSEFRGSSVCRLHRIDDETYAVSRHGSRIVWIHPDHYVVNLQGWQSAPTTRNTVWEVTRAMTYCRGSDYETAIGIGGYPYFAGIRLTPRGEVFEEDRRPWRKRYISKEGQKAWRELKKWLRMAAEARCNIGEFAHSLEFPHRHLHARHKRIQELCSAYRTWMGTPPGDVPHAPLRLLFPPVDSWEAAEASLGELRADFYASLNFYEYRETK